MYRQEIDMTNIKLENSIVRLINALNQEGIDLEVDCGTSGKRKPSSNAAEDNLQSSNEAGNNNIDTQTNNMVVDNAIQRKASRKEPARKEPEDNEIQRQAPRQEPVEFNEVQK